MFTQQANVRSQDQQKVLFKLHTLSEWMGIQQGKKQKHTPKSAQET